MRVKLISKISAVCLAALACVLLFGAGKTALAANPTTIDFQGKVVNSDGTNVTNGTYSFVFRIYNTASPSPATACSGDATCLFEETQSSVTVTNGTFQVELGSTCTGGLVAANACTKSAAGGLNFNTNSALYLTLQFNGDSSGTHGGFMWPVIHLTSVPYAYYADNAGSLGGISSNNFVQFATGTLQADSSTNNSIAVNKTGASGDILLLQANSKNALEVNNAGTTLLGQAGASGLNGTLTFNNAAGANTVSLSLQANPGSSYTLLLPTTGPSTSQCLQTDSTTANQLKFASCSGGSSSLATDYNSAATTGNTITLASAGGPMVVQDNSTPLTGSLFTVMGNACASSSCKYLDVSSVGIAVTGLTVNGNATIAAGDYVKITGSGTRPSSPTAGTLYYDTSANTLLTYNGSKWMSDKSASTKIVAMGTATGCTGTSPAASSNPDGADYVVTSCTDAATTINTALNAVSSAGGGTVYLEEGTYIIGSTSISIPDNVTLSGAGAATVIKFKDSVGGSTYYGITNTNTVSGKNVTIRNLTFDGNLSNNSVLGTFYGIYLNGVTTAGQVLNTTVKNVAFGFGITLNNSSNTVVSGNTTTGNSSHGIYLNGSSNNIVTNNLTSGNSSSGIALSSANNNAVNANQIISNTNYGIYSFNSFGNIFNGDTIQLTGSYGLFLSGSYSNQIISNKIIDNGGSTANNALYLQSGSYQNDIANNDITDSNCSSTCYAINITDSGSTRNYITSNHMVGDGTNAASISDAASSNIYANQSKSEKGDANFTNSTNSPTAFQIQTAGAADTLLTADTSANKVVIGNATGTNTSTTLLVLDSSTADPTTGFNGAMYYNTTNNKYRCYINGAWADCAGSTSSLLSSSYNTTATTGNTITLASSGGPVVVQDNSTPLTGSLFTVMSNGCLASTCKYMDVSSTGIAVTGLTANGNISITGSGTFDQSASSGTFKTGTGNVSLNGNTTVAAGAYIKITGSGTRPSSPTAGTLYYDTSVNKLLTYNGTKWMSDKTTATKIVAMGTATGCTGTSPVASTNPDGADYTITSCTDAATTINTALSSLPSTGGVVYLEDGTYIINGTTSINIPDNTTLLGSGNGTVIKFKDSVGAGTWYAVTNSDTSTGKNVNIQNLLIDGNKGTNGSSGTFYGIYLTGLSGAKISGTTIQNVAGTGAGIYISGSNDNVVGNVVINNANFGVYVTGSSSSNNVISGNNVNSNTGGGIALYASTNNNSITGNTASNEGYNGITLNSSSGNTISGNISNSNGSYNGINLTSSSNNTITGNTTNSDSAGINLSGSTYVTISGNTANSNAEGIYLTGTSTNNTVTGNTLYNNSQYGVGISSSNSNGISGNTATSSGTYGIYISGSSNNSVSGNKLDNTGGTTHNNAIYLAASSTANSINNNDVTDGSCSTDCYAIDISDAGSTANYFSGNHFGFSTTTYIYNPNNDAETFDNQEITSNGDTIFMTNANSSTAFQVQAVGGSTVLGVATSSTEANNYVGLGFASNVNGRLLFNNSAGTNTVTLQAQAVNPGSSFALSLPTALPGASNYCIVSSNLGILSFLACGAGSTATVTLTPEYPGAVMTGDGTNNTGTMTSDFCSNGVGSLPAIATGCNTGESHNFYQWTANATNDYEIFTKWQVPSDFSSFSAVKFNGFRTSASDAVTLTLYDATGASCGSASIAGTVNTWNDNTAVTTSCTPSPGDVLTLDMHLSVGVNSEFARAGEISITYNRK